MIDGWAIVRFLHVLAAIVWVGGQLLLSAVVVPATRRSLTPEVRGPLFQDVGRRFATLSNWGLLPVLLVTGLALAWHRGVTLGGLTRPGYGGILGAKIVLFGVAVLLAVVHGMVASAGRSTASRALGISGLAVSVVIVLLATALVP